MEKWLIAEGSKTGIWIPKEIELSLEAEIDILLAAKIAAKLGENSEISGIGRVRANDDCSFNVSDIIIPKQTSNPFDTIFLDHEMNVILEELETQGKNHLEFYFWWHSHGKISAFFSSTDDEMITTRLYVMLNGIHKSFYPDIPEETMSGPFLSLVVNIYGEMSARCDFLHRFSERRRQFTFGIPVTRHFPELSEEERNFRLNQRYEAIKGEIEKRVFFNLKKERLRFGIEKIIETSD